MARVPEHDGLSVSQPSLELLYVGVTNDVRLLVDSGTFRYMENEWVQECVSLLEDSCDELLLAIREKDTQSARYLLSQLHQPNKTHLGRSVGQSQGGGVGGYLADQVAEVLAHRAAHALVV